MRTLLFSAVLCTSSVALAVLPPNQVKVTSYDTEIVLDLNDTGLFNDIDTSFEPKHVTLEPVVGASCLAADGWPRIIGQDNRVPSGCGYVTVPDGTTGQYIYFNGIGGWSNRLYMVFNDGLELVVRYRANDGTCRDVITHCEAGDYYFCGQSWRQPQVEATDISGNLVSLGTVHMCFDSVEWDR